MSQEAPKKLDEFHYHEALDRCYCVEVIIQEMLLDHPVMEQHKECTRQSGAAIYKKIN
jgi:hypothetical protein